MELNKGTRNIALGVVVLLIPGAGLALGGLLIYKGIQRLRKQKEKK